MGVTTASTNYWSLRFSPAAPLCYYLIVCVAFGRRIRALPPSAGAIRPADGIALLQTEPRGTLVQKVKLVSFGESAPALSIPRRAPKEKVSLAVAVETVALERTELRLQRLRVELDSLDGFSGSGHVPRVHSAERADCKPAPSSAWLAFGVYMTLWVIGSLLFTASAGENVTSPVKPSRARNGGWDKARSLLMVFVIATHWIGKWGVQNTLAGWVFLNWAFSFHVVGFVLLSGVFSSRYAAKISGGGFAEYMRLFWGCADLFIVYVIFSWLRGAMYFFMDNNEVSVMALVLDTMKSTFLFHQGPWYLAALVVWRCCTPMLCVVGHARMTGWLSPVLLMAVSLVVAWSCPYGFLGSQTDPFAAREVLHYLPIFVAGLLLGQDRLESLATCCGSMTPGLALGFLACLAGVIYFQLAWLFESEDLRWILLKKDVPPDRAGGAVLMLALYGVKITSSLAALTCFSAPWPSAISAIERLFEKTGARSLAVYVLHMVFIMVPGEALCVQGLIEVKAVSGPALVAMLLALAGAVNLLCASDLSHFIFKPLLQPLAVWPDLLATTVRRLRTAKQQCL